MSTSIDILTGETVELLQALIRNQCVNDGTPESGHEVRSAELLRNELEGYGVDFELFETEPGRVSLVARYEGTDPDAPDLCLCAHTDVVPANPDGWTNDPFGGELITSADGVDEVWGRGAVDMLNLTSSMLVAFREVVRTGKRYPGDIVYFAVADEEAGSVLGAKQLLQDHWDVLHCDYVISEYGGTPSFGDDGTTVLLTTGEKHSGARRITVRGTPSHGSMSYATDNALIKASEIVRRIATAELAPRLDEVFAARVGALGLDPDIQKQLLDPAHINDALAALPPALASNLHSCSHMTINPNKIQSGEKLNTVPDTAVLELDIRMLPGQTQQDIDQLLPEIIGADLMPSVEIEWYRDDLTNGFGVSSTESPLWDALGDAIRIAYPEATVMPSLVTGGTDCRFYRERGIPAYGAGLLSDKVPLSEFLSRFHGNDERIDVDSLRLTTQLFLDVFDRLWR